MYNLCYLSQFKYVNKFKTGQINTLKTLEFLQLQFYITIYFNQRNALKYKAKLIYKKIKYL